MQIETMCPVCGKVHDMHSIAFMQADKPEVDPCPGDITVCIKCFSILEFDRKLRLKKIGYKTWTNNIDAETREQVVMVQRRLKRFKEMN